MLDTGDIVQWMTGRGKGSVCCLSVGVTKGLVQWRPPSRRMPGIARLRQWVMRSKMVVRDVPLVASAKCYRAGHYHLTLDMTGGDQSSRQ